MTIRIELPVISARLTLRRPSQLDVDDVHAYQQRPDVAKYLYRQPWTRQKTETVLNNAAKAPFAATGDDLYLVVQRSDSPKVIGEVLLKLANLEASQAEIGYVFNPDFSGHGLATEAAQALLKYGFEVCKFHRIFARLDAENTGSWRLCERLGLRQEARLVEADLRGTEWGTELVYAMLDHEWQSRSALLLPPQLQATGPQSDIRSRRKLFTH